MSITTPEQLNILLAPGITEIFKTNNLTTGNVHAAQVYIEVDNFQSLLVSLGEDLFHRTMNRLIVYTHALAAKYHGLFAVKNPDMLAVTFGVRKDDIKDNHFFAQKALFFADHMMSQNKILNQWLTETIRSHYNQLRNRYLMLPAEERTVTDLVSLRLNLRIGVACSDPTSRRQLYQMQMMKLGSDTAVSYGAYGGAPFLANQLCSHAGKNQIWVCENTVHKNRYIYEFGQAITLKDDIYGDMKGMPLVRVKTVYDIFLTGKYMKERAGQTEIQTLVALSEGLPAGQHHYREINQLPEKSVPKSLSITNQQKTAITIAEYETFQGRYMGATVNALLTYTVSDILGIDRRNLIPLGLVSAWFYFLMNQDEYFQPDELFPLWVPEEYIHFEYAELLSELQSGYDTSREAQIVRAVYEADRYMFDHYFDTTGKRDVSPDTLKEHIVKEDNPFTQEIYDALLRVLE